MTNKQQLFESMVGDMRRTRGVLLEGERVPVPEGYYSGENVRRAIKQLLIQGLTRDRLFFVPMTYNLEAADKYDNFFPNDILNKFANVIVQEIAKKAKRTTEMRTRSDWQEWERFKRSINDFPLVWLKKRDSVWHEMEPYIEKAQQALLNATPVSEEEIAFEEERERKRVRDTEQAKKNNAEREERDLMYMKAQAEEDARARAEHEAYLAAMAPEEKENYDRWQEIRKKEHEKEWAKRREEEDTREYARGPWHS